MSKEEIKDLIREIREINKKIDSITKDLNTIMKRMDKTPDENFAYWR